MNSREVFISYARDGGDAYASKLEDLINATGLRAFRDKTKMGTGDLWQEMIDKALQDCFAVVVIVTEKAALDSRWVTYEWAYALGLKKPVLALMFSPEALAGCHEKLRGPVNYDTSFFSPTEETWTNLLERLQVLYEQTHVPSTIIRAMDAAEDWRKENREAALDFLRYNTHHSTFDTLMTLCDSYFPETAKIASIKLGGKIHSYSKDQFPHPFIERDIFLAKAIQRLEDALLDQALWTQAGGLLQRFNTPESIHAMYRAFIHGDDYYKSKILDFLLEVTNTEVIEVLKEINAESFRWRVKVLKRLGQFEDTDSLQDIEKFLIDEELDFQLRYDILQILRNYKTIDVCQTIVNILKYYGGRLRITRKDHNRQSMISACLAIFQEISVENNLIDAKEILVVEILNDRNGDILHQNTQTTYTNLTTHFSQK